MFVLLILITGTIVHNSNYYSSSHPQDFGPPSSHSGDCSLKSNSVDIMLFSLIGEIPSDLSIAFVTGGGMKAWLGWNVGIDTPTIATCYASRPRLQASCQHHQENNLAMSFHLIFIHKTFSDPNNSGVASSETVLAYWDSLGISNGSQVWSPPNLDWRHIDTFIWSNKLGKSIGGSQCLSRSGPKVNRETGSAVKYQSCAATKKESMPKWKQPLLPSWFSFITFSSDPDIDPSQSVRWW